MQLTGLTEGQLGIQYLAQRHFDLWQEELEIKPPIPRLVNDCAASWKAKPVPYESNRLITQSPHHGKTQAWIITFTQEQPHL